MSDPLPVCDNFSGGRKYVCFVCGVPFDIYQDFSSHVKETHEEGREWVKCPLARCQAPVRDVRLHYRVKHPSEKPPTQGQMRALIWSDQKQPSKKKKKMQFAEGYITSQKNGGTNMHYRSSWERDVYMCLEHCDDVLGYKVESFPVEYYWKGRRKRYFPDLFVSFKDGHHEVWEIKPSNQKQMELNKAKWLACEGYCEARKWTFKIVTEEEIRQLKQRARLDISMKIEYGSQQNSQQKGV